MLLRSQIEKSGSGLYFNLKGCQKVAGRRCEAKTSGKRLIGLHSEGVPDVLAPSRVLSIKLDCVPVVCDQRLLSRSPFGLPSTLLQNRVTAALAVIGCSFVKCAVVVVEDQVLAFITNHVGNSSEVVIVFRDDESRRAKRHYHSRSENVTTLIVISTSVLGRGQRDIR